MTKKKLKESEKKDPYFGIMESIFILKTHRQSNFKRTF